MDAATGSTRFSPAIQRIGWSGPVDQVASFDPKTGSGPRRRTENTENRGDRDGVVLHRRTRKNRRFREPVQATGAPPTVEIARFRYDRRGGRLPARGIRKLRVTSPHWAREPNARVRVRLELFLALGRLLPVITIFQ